MKENVRKILSVLFVTLSITLSATLTLAFPGCTNANDTVSDTELLLDTFVTITLYGTKDEKPLAGAMALVREYEDMLSKTVEGSDIYRINQAEGESVEVSPETAQIIRTALYYYELSGGIFDITVGGVTELWDFKTGEGIVPDKEKMNAALEHVGSDKIVIDGNTVRLTDPETKLDLGAIAKGYIADKLSEYLKEAVKDASAVIDLGGNILTVGAKPSTGVWTIGIQRPFALTREMLAKTKLGEKSVVSSGIYERYFYVGDTIYYHILNPATGLPYPSDLTAVTIFSAKSVDGDALSTTVFCLGLDKGLALVESLPGVEAVFIPNEGEITCSSGIGEGNGFEIPVEWIDTNVETYSE